MTTEEKEEAHAVEAGRGEMPTRKRTIEGYAAAVASATPTPGGGSVAAVSAAFAAGLSEMVCRLTLAKTVSEHARATLNHAESVAAECRTALLDLAYADENAYGGYRQASALPKETVDERAGRAAEMQAALAVAAEAPRRCAATVLTFLRTLAGVAEFGTSHALSDVATACMIGEAALKGALLNVRVNAELLKDVTLATNLLREADQLETDARFAATATLDMITIRSTPTPPAG